MPEYRGAGVNLPVDREKIGLPLRPFLFTIDQIATMLNLRASQVNAKYIYFEGRSTGSRRLDLMVARNIAPPDERPEWRVAERELLRWLRKKGFRYYDRAVISN